MEEQKKKITLQNLLCEKNLLEKRLESERIEWQTTYSYAMSGSRKVDEIDVERTENSVKNTKRMLEAVNKKIDVYTKIEEKIKAYEIIKVPKGSYQVCVWDPSKPEKSIPEPVGKPYKTEGYAKNKADSLNKKAEDEDWNTNPIIRMCRGKTEYFVIDDKRNRIY
jgi:hypothetical protein